MATATVLNPDTVIGVKVLIAGTNRRFKVTLRELGPTVFPQKLRTLLGIQPDQSLVLERYSDSAASFITLDPENPHVYKQLYRAAKAKLKLRIKATVGPSPSAALAQPANAPAVTEAAVPSVTAVEDDAGQDEKLPSLGSDPVADEVWARYPSLLEAVVAKGSQPVGTAVEPVICTFPSASSPPQHDADRRARAQEWAMQHQESVVRVVDPTTSVLSRWHYSIFCNNCDAPIPDAHYHCSICEDGDLDLCQACIDSGVLCGDASHWLIRRFLKDGRVITSTTERIAPRKPLKDLVDASPAKREAKEEAKPEPDVPLLTCNSCVEVSPSVNFVTCVDCEDYDLCISCHLIQKHGHHPGHTFRAAGEATELEPVAISLCRPGRNVSHLAICDGCNQTISGVRNKCLDCPDWDYCSNCLWRAAESHPDHRFAPIYEPIAPASRCYQSHLGISCDGPLCLGQEHSFIVGERYKCAICHDTDFCANCEASPLNRHNRSHPMIKFKTPVKTVSVATLGENERGEALAPMGDYHARTRSTATETTPAMALANAATQVQIVADVKPSEAVAAETSPGPELDAHFVRDSVADGTPVRPGQVFTQTWTLFNPGPVTWPAGSSVRFVGGDHMRNVDPAHASSVVELEQSMASNEVGERGVPTGLEIDFKVTLRAPTRPGKAISYWRLTAPTGEKFGHRLWCEVDVSDKAVTDEVKADVAEDTPAEQSSTMIFPTLEKESPVGSTHEAMAAGEAADETKQPAATDELASEVASLTLEEGSSDDDGFNTDEEYDILNASDEELPGNEGKAE